MEKTIQIAFITNKPKNNFNCLLSPNILNNPNWEIDAEILTLENFGLKWISSFTAKHKTLGYRVWGNTSKGNYYANNTEAFKKFQKDLNIELC